MVRPWRKNQHLCIRIYHQQFDLCLMAIDFLFLNLRTTLLCTLKTKTVSSNSEEQLPSASMQTSTDSSNHKITEGELNDFIKDLELPKNKAELLASRLQQWNLLHHSAKVTFLKTVGYFTYCKDTDGLMDAMHMRHSPEQWRLFIVVT